MVKYFARMMPLLLRWSTVEDYESRIAALQFLVEVLQHTWPRMLNMNTAFSKVFQNLPEVVSDKQERDLRLQIVTHVTF